MRNQVIVPMLRNEPAPVNTTSSYRERRINALTEKVALVQDLQECIKKYVINVYMSDTTEKEVGLMLIDLLKEEAGAVRDLKITQERLDAEEAASR